MSEKRKPSRFAVYRLTATGGVFMSNHVTEDGAKHSAACLQVCAPAGISYVVDPPNGVLSLSEPKPGIRAFVARMFSGASDAVGDGASSHRVPIEEAHRSPVYLSQIYSQWRVLGKTRTGRDSWRLLQRLMTDEQAANWAAANGKQVKKEPHSAKTRTTAREPFVGSGQAIPDEGLPKKSRTST